MCPNLSPISPKLILYIGTKVEDTMKLNIHWKATAMLLQRHDGIREDFSNQYPADGPQLNMNEAL